MVYVAFCNILNKIVNFEDFDEFLVPNFIFLCVLKMIKLRVRYIGDIFREKNHFVPKICQKMIKFRHFWTLKFRQKSSFQLFSIFSFAESSYNGHLAIRKNGWTLSCFLLFYIGKTAENAEFAEKPRIFRKLGVKFRNKPQIRIQHDESI